MQHAAALKDLTVEAELKEPILFQCDKCDFTTNSQQGVNVHTGTQHEEQQKPVAHDEESIDESNVIENFVTILNAQSSELANPIFFPFYRLHVFNKNPTDAIIQGSERERS